MGNLISERGVMEKSQEKFKGLRYSIDENAEDLLSKFGKYMTTILNDGGGGVIILKIWANIDVLVDQIKQEIGKITPRVQDSEYKISSKRRNGDIGEIEIDVEPVPWGFEAYAAADGNIYTPETADHATDENQMDLQFEYTEPKMNTKMKPTVEIGEMETHSDCELGDIRQEKTDKNTGAPPSDIKEIIDDCVNDLRDIKAKLGISNRCDQPEQMDTKKITSDVEKCIISVSEEEKTGVRLHHSKSLSDNLFDAENRRPFLQMKSGSLTDNEMKTLCEDFEFNQCKDFNSFPTTTENWIQVDGEGYVVSGDVDHRESDSEYFLPQLDGMYDEENIQAEKLDPDYANNDDEPSIPAEEFSIGALRVFAKNGVDRKLVNCRLDRMVITPISRYCRLENPPDFDVIKSHLAETIRREHIIYFQRKTNIKQMDFTSTELVDAASKLIPLHGYHVIVGRNNLRNQYEEDIYAGIERDERIVIGNILDIMRGRVDNKNNNEYKSYYRKRASMKTITAKKPKYINGDMVWPNYISSYPGSWWTRYAKKRYARIERNFKIVLANISDIMSGRVDNKKNNAYKSNLSFDFVAQKEKRMDEIRLSCFYVSILLRSLNDKQEKRLATGNVLSFSKMSPNLFDELVEKLGKIMWEDQIHIPIPRPIDIRLQQIDQWIQVETEIQRIQNRGRTFKDRIGFICSDYCDRYQQRLFGYTPIGLIESKTRDLVDIHLTARRKKKEFLSSSVASVGSCNSNEGYPERKVQVPHTEFTRKFQHVRIQITKTNQWERIMTNELAGKEDRDLYNTEECITMVPDTHFKTTQVVSKVRTLIPIAFPITYQFGFTVTTEPGCLVIV